MKRRKRFWCWLTGHDWVSIPKTAIGPARDVCSSCGKVR